MSKFLTKNIFFSFTEDNVNLTPGEKRFERVKRWTKKVNIFEKDFIVVPICEHSHWFVAVICFPGMIGKRRMDNDEPILDEKDQEASKEASTKSPSTKGAKKDNKKVLQIGNY